MTRPTTTNGVQANASSLHSRLPVRAGFRLELMGQRCSAWPEIGYRGDNRQYFGVDPHYSYEELVSGQAPKDSLIALWDRWIDAEESGEILWNLNLVRQFQRAFAKFDEQLEAIYVEIVAIPEDLQRQDGLVRTSWAEEFETYFEALRLVLKHVPARPDDLVFLGHDVSSRQIGFYSAIMNAETEDYRPILPSILNENGLITQVGDAVRVMSLANETDSHRPFCVLAIWGVPE